jgi:hypothetical protein
MLSRQVLGCGSGKCCGTGRSIEDRLENGCRDHVPQVRAQTIRGRAKFHRNAIFVATRGTPTPFSRIATAHASRGTPTDRMLRLLS